jgi:type II secretory pathway pseudopilin PulG
MSGLVPEVMKMLKKWLGKIRRYRSESGVTLVEAVVVVAILGGGVLTMILTMSGGALAVSENDEEVTAQSLARTQMEYIKNCAYDPGATTYPTISTPDGYSISVGVSVVPDTNTNIQKVTANISRDGTLIMTVTDYKVNR